MTRQRGVLFVLIGIALNATSLAFACETCAIYNATRLREGTADSWSLTASEQFTEYEESSVGNQADELRDGEILKRYSITQFDLSYDFSSALGLQLSLPIVAREFTEVKHYRRSTDSESGVGDMAVLVDYSPFSVRDVHSALHTSLFAGIKMPTGDTGSLEDQIVLEEEELERGATKHHQAAGIPGLQGRVLSLGTGSWDTFYGLGALARWDRLMLVTTGEYTIRTEGDFDYRFANDILWSAAPSFFLVLNDDFTLAISAELSGEHKEKDVYQGEKVKGSAVSTVYAGPSFIFTALENWSGQFALQLPVQSDSPDSIVVPDYRLRAVIDYRF